MATSRLPPATPRLREIERDDRQTQEKEKEEKEEQKDSEKTWDNLITLETFSDWISVAAYKIECLAIKIYRWRVQTCILLVCCPLPPAL
jgi:hypothetical protein